MAKEDSSSKVTVLYYDPHNVYQLLRPSLLPRLPLRNLHWESHAGPLRSIDSLHIDLVPVWARSDGLAEPYDVGIASTVYGEEPDIVSDDALGQAGNSARRASPALQPGERRHQIPGLRQTPYLKVLFIRCDDNDTYKTQVRLQVREWIKEHTTAAQQTSGENDSQENHDAFEWLVVHVIVPNTAAATQPRFSGRSAEPSLTSTLDKPPAARWRGGGSTTIFEKLRADFNGSSKDAADRVAQIRIGVNDVSYDLLPRVVPAIPGAYTDSPQDSENAWLDLVAKLKLLILASFDWRVSQYEEDIREKDRQRSLPGWNFCTFFVLKEGLARGFESVGLVEDALAGYDELAAGLDAVIKDHADAGSNVSHGGSFLPYTKELLSRLENTRAANLKPVEPDLESEGASTLEVLLLNSLLPENDVKIPLDNSRKPVRERILSNNISIFDFRCYIFFRQMSLLVRQASASLMQVEPLSNLKGRKEPTLERASAQSEAFQLPGNMKNLVTLSELCKRAERFIPAIASVMRDDMQAGLVHWQEDTQAADTRSKLSSEYIPEMIVSSFTYALTRQVLTHTSITHLPMIPLLEARTGGLAGLEGKGRSFLGAEEGTSSPVAERDPAAVHIRAEDFQLGGDFTATSGFSEHASIVPVLKNSALEDLAARRGALVLLSRNILTDLAKRSGWNVGWIGVSEHPAPIESNTSFEGEVGSYVPSALHGLSDTQLRGALHNRNNFIRLYALLTDVALRHAIIARQRSLVQAGMTDLALLHYHQGNHTAACEYLSRVTTYYCESSWSSMEESTLMLYAKCLKYLQKQDEYIRVLLRLTNKIEAVEQATHSQTSCSKDLDSSNSMFAYQDYSDDLLRATQHQEQDFTIPLGSFFSRIVVEDRIHYDYGQDSFALQLTLHYRLHGNLALKQVRLRVTPLSGEPCRELWLQTQDEILLKPGRSDVQVRSNVIIPGVYTVSEITIYTGRITMRYAHDHDCLSSKHSRLFKGFEFRVFHQVEAFGAKLSALKDMHLDQQKSLDLTITSGWNDLKSGELHLKAGTAGLRLQTSDVRVVEGLLDIRQASRPGVLAMGVMTPRSSATLRVPFTLEHEVNDVFLKLEVSYTTCRGTFHFANISCMSVTLPLGVNVQDFFKHRTLFSRFTISSAGTKPLRLLRTHLGGSDVFQVLSGSSPFKPVVVFNRQPASALYRISPKATLNRDYSRCSKSTIFLILHYACIEDEIHMAFTLAVQQVLHLTHLDSFTGIVVPAILDELRVRLSPYDIEQCAMTERLSTSILLDVQWHKHFAGLGRSQQRENVAAQIIECLRAWQQETPYIEIIPTRSGPDLADSCRSIVIPVEIPSVTVVHTASLKLSTQNSDSSFAGVLNEPMTASLHIRWTRAWDMDVVAGDSAHSRKKDLHFVYEVVGPSDTWLIGGRRKGHFDVSTDVQASKQDLQFPIVLVPLRDGFLPYPSIEIKLAPIIRSVWPRSSNSEPEHTQSRHSASCETDYQNANETVHVVRDTWKTTLSLDASGPMGGAWLLECQPRQAITACRDRCKYDGSI